MPRTTRPTTCWAKCGVRGFATKAEKKMLALATEYKQRLAELHYWQHCAEIEARNRLFPELWTALTRFEIARAAQRDCESAIKRENSDSAFKHKNSNKKGRALKNKTHEQLFAELKRLKTVVSSRHEVVVQERQKYNAVKKSIEAAIEATILPPHVLSMLETNDEQKEAKKAAKKKFRDSLFKNVKGIEKKRKVYSDILSRIDDPVVRELKTIEWDADLEMKRLNKEYQDRGLNSGTRGDIDVAVKPKTKKDGPGMKYVCGEFPQVEPVNTLTVQFGDGGVTQEKLLGGKGKVTMVPATQRQRVRKDYSETNAQKKFTEFGVRQQIGTDKLPVFAEYRVNVHKPLPEDIIIQQWKLCFDEFDKRSVSLIVSHKDGFQKKTGEGTFTVDSGHKTQECGGIKVADFLGDNVNEKLILPSWLVKAFNEVHDRAAEIDESAKQFLEHRAIKIRKNRPQAIQKIAKDKPDDGEANAWVAWYTRVWAQRNRKWRRLIRIRNKIFENAVARLRATHSHYIQDNVSYSKMSRNATRDVTDESAKLNTIARRNRQIAAPGTLLEMLKKSGLTVLTVDERGASSICEHCGEDNGDQPDRDKEIRWCKGCKKKWNKDRGACLEKLARADVPLVNIRAARTTDVFTTYVWKINDSSTNIRGGNRRRSQKWSGHKAA